MISDDSGDEFVVPIKKRTMVIINDDNISNNSRSDEVVNDVQIERSRRMWFVR